MKNNEASGESPGIAGSSPDIRDRVGLEQALRLSEQRYRLALRGSPVVVWECDTDLRFRFVDNLQPPITEPAQIIGKRDDEILPFDSVRELIEIKKRVLATGAGERGELSIPVANEIFNFEMVVEPIYNSGRMIAGLRGLAIDISERKRTEKTLRSVSAELSQTLQIADTGLSETLSSVGARNFGVCRSVDLKPTIQPLEARDGLSFIYHRKGSNSDVHDSEDHQ